MVMNFDDPYETIRIKGTKFLRVQRIFARLSASRDNETKPMLLRRERRGADALLFRIYRIYRVKLTREA